MTTLAELAAAVREVTHGRPVMYCHPLDFERVEHALTLLPADVVVPRLQIWNGTPAGEVVLARDPAWGLLP